MRERLELNPKTILPFLFFALFSLIWIGLEPVSECAVFASIDDGYYYPKIAQNYSISGKITYDNVTLTNGFHPLWEFIIIPFYLVFKNHSLALKAVYWLLIFMNLFNLFQYARINKRLRIGPAAFLLGTMVLFLNLRTFTLWFSMLESALELCLLLILALYWMPEYERHPFVLGALSSLLFLARTDTVFLAIVIFLYYFADRIIRKKTHALPKAILHYFMPVVILVGPYFLMNILTFGRLLPVSGARKIRLDLASIAAMPQTVQKFFQYWSARIAYFSSLNIQIIYALEIAGIIAAGAVLIYLFRQKKLTSTTYLFKRMAPFFIGASAHYFFIAAFMPAETVLSFWYLVQEILLVSLLLSALAQDLFAILKPSRQKMAEYAAAGLLILLSVGQYIFYPRYMERRTFIRENINLARAINKLTLPTDILTSFDSGIQSYFSERDIIGANGVAGDYELAEICRMENRYTRIIERYGAKWLAFVMPGRAVEQFRERCAYVSPAFNYSNIPDMHYVLIPADKFDEQIAAASRIKK